MGAWALEIFGWSESLRLLGPLKVSSMRGAVRGAEPGSAEGSTSMQESALTVREHNKTS